MESSGASRPYFHRHPTAQRDLEPQVLKFAGRSALWRADSLDISDQRRTLASGTSGPGGQPEGGIPCGCTDSRRDKHADSSAALPGWTVLSASQPACGHNAWMSLLD